MPQRVLVTGANRGLGLEFVRQALERGDTVIATCRHPDRADALESLRQLHPDRLFLMALDVTDSESLSEFARHLAQRIPALDCLINNAGMLPSGERFGGLKADDLLAAFAANAAAPLLLAQALAPLLAKGREPRIVNISSALGSIASTHSFGTPSYAISKAALNMAGVQMGQALAEQGIRVANLHPGWVKTDMGGAQAKLSPEESVRNLLETVDRLPADARGVFLDRNGAPLPW